MFAIVGCVEVVGCVKCEELVCWEDVPESVRIVFSSFLTLFPLTLFNIMLTIFVVFFYQCR